MSLNNYMPPGNRKRQKVYTRLGLLYRSSRPDVFCEKDVLRNFGKFTGKHLCQDLYFNLVAGLACNFIKIETLAQVFSCEFSANVWKVSLEYTITWKIKSLTSSLNLCATNKLAQITVLEATKMKQKPSMTNGVHKTGATVKNVKRYQPVKDACAVTKFGQLRHFI